jgi:hypothetical protein
MLLSSSEESESVPVVYVPVLAFIEFAGLAIFGCPGLVALGYIGFRTFEFPRMLEFPRALTFPCLDGFGLLVVFDVLAVLDKD